MMKIQNIETEFEKVYRTNREWYENSPDAFKIMIPGTFRNMLQFPDAFLSVEGKEAIEKLTNDLHDEVAFHYDRIQTWYSDLSKEDKTRAIYFLNNGLEFGTTKNHQAAMRMFINFLENIRPLGPMKPFE